jgi:hypothetical protein
MVDDDFMASWLHDVMMSNDFMDDWILTLTQMSEG